MKTKESIEVKKKSMQEWPKVAIIILNWNGWKDTIECLESVFRNTYPNYQVIVIDNGSTDGSMEKIKIWAEGKQKVLTPKQTHPLYYLSHPPVEKPIPNIYYTREEAERGDNFKLEEKVIREWQERRKDNGKELNLTSSYPLIFIQTGKNLGFAGGNNVGIRYTIKKDEHDYILLLNNDTVVEKDFLESAVNFAEKNKSIGVVGGKIYFYGDSTRIWSTGGHINWIKGRGIHAGNGKIDVGQFDRAREVSLISGALMLVKREVFRKVGFLPEEYFFGAEEWDFSVVVRQNGYRLYYIPKFICHHKVGAAHKTFDPKFIYNTYYNKLLFQQKFLPPLLWRIWNYLFYIYYKSILRIRLSWRARRSTEPLTESMRNYKPEMDHVLEAIRLARRDIKARKVITNKVLQEIERNFLKQ